MKIVYSAILVLLLTNSMIHLKRIETFNPVAHGIHLNRIFLAWRHICHFCLCLSYTGQFYPPWVILCSISNRKLGVQGICWRLPMDNDCVTRYFLDAQILWRMGHCNETITSTTITNRKYVNKNSLRNMISISICAKNIWNMQSVPTFSRQMATGYSRDKNKKEKRSTKLSNKRFVAKS